MLKMEWVHGDSLGAYIAKNLSNRENLIALALRWVEMSNALSKVGIAHGDLQHGNVLIMPDGQIRLIDYDGMYVPTLAGRRSEELGQRNYQHPLRTGMDFGPSLDHFSEWVIYSSLILVSLDPTLWSRLKGGDECLLFRRSDFENPESSNAFNMIERAKDDRIRSLGEALAAGDPLVAAHLGKVVPTADIAVALNTAFMGDGAVIWIAQGATLARPIHLVFMNSGAPGNSGHRFQSNHRRPL
jgi:hypothetical protein